MSEGISEEEWKDAVNKVIGLAVWLVKEIAIRDGIKPSAAASLLILSAPEEPMRQTLNMIEQAFRQKGQ